MGFPGVRAKVSEARRWPAERSLHWKSGGNGTTVAFASLRYDRRGARKALLDKPKPPIYGRQS